MPGHILSKSTFIRGYQCLKSLYLNKHRPFLRDRLQAAQLNKFDRGHDVGKLAWQLFPGGEDCSPGHPSAYARAAKHSLQRVQDGVSVLYETVFQYDEVLVMPDILVKSGDGYAMYEVKSSLRISETYLMDAALQFYVLKGAGVNVKSVHIVYVNKDYVYPGGSVNPESYFLIEDVTERAEVLQDRVVSLVREEKMTLQSSHSPSISVGTHCFIPYPCDFTGHCWKQVPEDAIIRMPFLSPEERFRLYHSGINDFTQLQHCLPDREEVYIASHAFLKRQVELNPHKLLEVLHYHDKRYFFKAVYIENSIPVTTGTRPFEPLPLIWMTMDENGQTESGMGEPCADRVLMQNHLNSLHGIRDCPLIVWERNPDLYFDAQADNTGIWVILSEIYQSPFLYFPTTHSVRDIFTFAPFAGVNGSSSPYGNDAEFLRAYFKSGSGMKFLQQEGPNYLRSNLMTVKELYDVAVSFCIP